VIICCIVQACAEIVVVHGVLHAFEGINMSIKPEGYRATEYYF
jgi:hypothetical protein